MLLLTTGVCVATDGKGRSQSGLRPMQHPSRMASWTQHVRANLRRTWVRRRPPTRFSSEETSLTAGFPGCTAWMMFCAGLFVTGDGLSDGPPVPGGGAMS